jgi:hypothetical protein
MTTFDQWTRHIFDHPLPPPVADDVKEQHERDMAEAGRKLSAGEVKYAEVAHLMRPQPWFKWWWQDDAPHLDELTPLQAVTYITRTFNEIEQVAQPYTDAQLEQGLNYLTSSACSNYMHALTDPLLPVQNRVAAVQSFATVYEKLYAVRCDRKLGSQMTAPSDNPLNMSCYMWWDVICLYPAHPNQLPEESGFPSEHQAMLSLVAPCFDVMGRTLALDHIACQEAALHGLGHWQHAYPQHVAAMIDAFLDANPNLEPDLRAYAEAARVGMVQ